MTRTLSMALLAALIVMTTSVACGPLKTTSGDLQSAILVFNDDIRWGRHGDAANYLAPAVREAFLDEKVALEDQIVIVDYEIVKVTPDAELTKATASVKYTWHLVAATTIETSHVKQHWQRFGEVWYCIDREIVSDDPAEKALVKYF